jgi:hypothetical protein
LLAPFAGRIYDHYDAKGTLVGIDIDNASH